MKDLNYSDFADNKPLQNALRTIKEAIESVETGKANISIGSGAPSGGSNKDLYIDTSTNRLYVNVNGTWKYTALT